MCNNKKNIEIKLKHQTLNGNIMLKNRKEMVKIFIKTRCESKELQILKYLDVRESLPDEKKQHFLNLKKGFEGEKLFDKWLQNYLSDGLILCDLLFEVNQTLFQIDTLLLKGSKIYLFEVKNFEGDFYLAKDRWYTIYDKEINDPLMQLERSKSLFRQLLYSLGYHDTIEAYLVFVNPEFTLYQSRLNAPIIYPNQLNKFLKKLNDNSTKQSSTHLQLIKQLLPLHLEDSPYTRIPPYNFQKIKKGIICKSCFTLVEHVCTYRVVCKNCGYIERLETAVLRQIEEYKLLFPEKEISTNSISEWCKIIKNKRAIRAILMENFTPVGYGRGLHYVEKMDVE